VVFDPFGDFSTRGYLRNFEKVKELTKVKVNEHVAFLTNLGEAFAALSAQETLRYSDVLQIHKILFGSLYPWAGDDRSVTAPNIAIAKAGRTTLFAHPNSIQRAADYALARGQDAEFMRVHPGEVMGLLAHAHPFLDGNGRTIMVVHCEMARRTGMAIRWDEVARLDYLTALTRELENPSQGELDRYLRPYLLFGTEAERYKLALNNLKIFTK
jgi:cell filamentation protein